VLTGYNTDVEYDGVVYHVQTEDKGLETPVILSLVYTGGAILASKRSPYDDLVARGFDEGILAERLQRQHKLICAAVHAGRIDDLKQMSEREPAARSSRQKKPASSGATPTQTESKAAPAGRPSEDRFSISTSDEAADSLQVTLLEDKALRSGESVTLRLLVSRGSRGNRKPLQGARVILKTLGTTFRPMKTISTTDNDGVARISVSLPEFKSGRAAILVRAEAGGEAAELRRIIQPG